MGAICEKCFGVKQEGEEKINQRESSNYGTTSATMVTHAPAGLSLRARISDPPPVTDLNEVEIATTTVERIDKRFQEQANLFNKLLESHKLLKEKYLEFIGKKQDTFFLSYSDILNATNSIKSEASDNIQIERRHKYRLEIIIKDGVSIPHATATKINTFNQLNQICYDLITKLPVLKQDVVDMTTNEEDQFKKDILVKSWSEEDEKMSTLKKLMENMVEFRKLPPNCEKMQTTPKELFDMILRASSVLAS